ncbi:MAG: hypothetical protein LBR60_04290 [Fibrobacter sp.]|jgi:hypothetical protein|nr:hypothetical protein [Fibrobacter sp.]
MPSFDKHKAQAQHNENLANHLNTSQKGLFNDWVVTACFYSSVHLVEAMTSKSKHLMVPANNDSRYPKDRPVPLVKRSGVSHTSDLENLFNKRGHELRDCVLRDNSWFFDLVGITCSYLRKESQTARYECQEITQDDADKAIVKLFDARKCFNGWALKNKIDL